MIKVEGYEAKEIPITMTMHKLFKGLEKGSRDAIEVMSEIDNMLKKERNPRKKKNN